jgi:Domain of unknown function (DUF4232)
MPVPAYLSRRRACGFALGCTVALAAAAPALGAGTAAAAAKACSTSGLVVWLDTQGSAAAGSTYFSLKFTNLSGRACTLGGYPGISAVNLAGRQLGSAGSRAVSPAHPVSLAAGATASAVLRITVAGNFPNTICRRVMAAGLRVYPPNQRASRIVPFPFEACSRVGPVYLSVRAVA